MTRVHTCNFKTIKHAIAYYAKQDIGHAHVARKVAAGEIVIGAADLKGRLFNWDQDGRAYYYE